MLHIRIAMILVPWFACLIMPAFAGSADGQHPAAGVVLAFNRAITERDMDVALAQLAEGSIQFQLHPAHPGMPADPPLTEDLRKSWQLVSAILFPSTDSYMRDVAVDAVHINGELATVWTRTRTVTHRKGQEKPMELAFSELYVLANKNNQGWKIIAHASNRPVDDISVGPSD